MAFSLALGKEIPFDSSSVKKALNSLGSSYKTLAIIFNLLSSWHSAPKEIWSTTFNEFKIFTAPSAKFSALDTE